MKHALIAASLVLVAGTVAGCGGDDSSKASSSASKPSGPPTTATTSTFCSSVKSIREDVGGIDPQAKDADIVKALKKAGSDLAAVGTPKGTPSDARQGLLITVKLFSGIPDDATKADISKAGTSLSKAEQAQEQAFGAYASKTCKL